MGRLAEDAALLERAVREGWPRDRGELRALLERRPDWAALLEGPEGVLAALGAEAEHDRRLTDEALALARAPGLRRARRWRPSPWLLSLAAALLVAVGWIVARATIPWTVRPPQYLGEQGAEPNPRDVSSVAVDHDGDRWTIRWKTEEGLLEAEAFLVEVRASGEGGQVLVPAFRTTATSFSPDAWESAAWPERVVVRVRRVGAGGEAGTVFVHDSGS